ncbi:MAG TPA: 50S ribosomal protein L4, partial [Methanocorpusculum sp.]|nr:50S ribosomal protein L4 [Methanocorpusculum sp.]
RRYKQVVSVLIVTSDKFVAGKNLAGVDCVSVTALNAAHLAPGCAAGRLTVWTEAAIKKLGEV